MSATAKRGEVLTREHCYIRERVNDATTPEFSLADCRVVPGVTTELHRLNVREWYVIVRGQGRVEVGTAPARDVKPGDVVEIPAGVAQRIRNIGREDLEFQCVCLPRFEAAGYEPLE
jgi:mannose-6-phosphate isomerase-like protein (cupin superfamily)